MVSKPNCVIQLYFWSILVHIVYIQTIEPFSQKQIYITWLAVNGHTCVDVLLSPNILLSKQAQLLL